jgi:hypothetical protein
VPRTRVIVRGYYLSLTDECPSAVCRDYPANGDGAAWPQNLGAWPTETTLPSPSCRPTGGPSRRNASRFWRNEASGRAGKLRMEGSSGDFSPDLPPQLTQLPYGSSDSARFLGSTLLKID